MCLEFAGSLRRFQYDVKKVKSNEKLQINVASKISWSQEKLARERARADDDYKDFQEDLLELMIISLEISFFKKCGVPPKGKIP